MLSELNAIQQDAALQEDHLQATKDATAKSTLKSVAPDVFHHDTEQFSTIGAIENAVPSPNSSIKQPPNLCEPERQTNISSGRVSRIPSFTRPKQFKSNTAPPSQIHQATLSSETDADTVARENSTETVDEEQLRFELQESRKRTRDLELLLEAKLGSSSEDRASSREQDPFLYDLQPRSQPFVSADVARKIECARSIEQICRYLSAQSQYGLSSPAAARTSLNTISTSENVMTSHDRDLIHLQLTHVVNGLLNALRERVREIMKMTSEDAGLFKRGKIANEFQDFAFTGGSHRRPTIARQNSIFFTKMTLSTEELNKTLEAHQSIMSSCHRTLKEFDRLQDTMDQLGDQINIIPATTQSDRVSPSVSSSSSVRMDSSSNHDEERPILEVGAQFLQQFQERLYDRNHISEKYAALMALVNAQKENTNKWRSVVDWYASTCKNLHQGNKEIIDGINEQAALCNDLCQNDLEANSALRIALKDMNIVMTMRDNTLRTSLSTLEQKLSDNEKEISTKALKIQTLEAKCADMRQELDTFRDREENDARRVMAEKEVERLKEHIGKLEQSLTVSQKECRLLEEKIGVLTNDHTVALAKMEDDHRKAQDELEEKATVMRAVYELSQWLRRDTNELKTIADEKDATYLEALHQLEQNLRQTLIELVTEKNHSKKLSGQLQLSETTSQSLENTLKYMEKEAAKKEDRLVILQKECEETANELATLRQKLGNLEEQWASDQDLSEALLSEKLQELAELEQKMRAQEADVQQAQALIAENEAKFTAELGSFEGVLRHMHQHLDALMRSSLELFESDSDNESCRQDRSNSLQRMADTWTLLENSALSGEISADEYASQLEELSRQIHQEQQQRKNEMIEGLYHDWKSKALEPAMRRTAELEQGMVDLQHALAARKKKYTEQIQYAARQLKYMKAKFSREAGFRSDLAYQKRYMQMRIDNLQSRQQEILAFVSNLDVDAPVGETHVRLSGPSKFRSVAFALIALQRMRNLKYEWDTLKKLKPTTIPAN
ncbi:hypothetical protein BZG36_02500 [Bifiguratus adelaidae]|uniref:Pericentrin/AKAP-450 centrosomal targeting domain-containing protein n=1 Tax=Bifiguratus adelaidae TaxID=1938954 RepID=A0A261Y2U7_9FUNG|nr:hypothetical protein BZG36_02500 [Bifiguratus adelaidae]